MTKQLSLVDAAEGPRRRRTGRRAKGAWRLDERTRKIGLEGVARARAVLAAARPAEDTDDSDEPAAA